MLLLILIGGFIMYKAFSTQKEEASLQQKHENFLKTHVLQNTLKLSKKERLAKGVPPNKYFEEKYLLEINPYTGRTHPENTYKVQQDLKEKKLYQQRTPGDAIDNQWIERGPNNVGGRTRVLLFDPNDATHKRVFAGGISGGLWGNDNITDENSSWLRVGIDENLSISCMAVDPNNSQIMYVGTGELYVAQQALGNGIWKSIDGGATWTNIYNIRGATVISGSSATVPGTYYVTDIIVRDADGDHLTADDSEVFASIGASFYSVNPRDTFVGINEYGLYKSTDAGTSWSKLIVEVDGRSVSGNDFEIGLDNALWLATTSNIYGKGGGRIYKSADGNIFTLKHTIPNARRTEISVSRQNANSVYVLARVVTMDVNDDLIAPFVSILKTVDAFATIPTALTLPNDADTNIPPDDFTRSQAHYNLTVEVDPTNDAIAYVGGIDLFRTTDSGLNWSQISKWSNNNNLATLDVSLVHADQHEIVFHPTDANTAIFGNDGGVYYSLNLSDSASRSSIINERNKDYNTVQFYNAAISQSSTLEYLIGGTQDNGTHFFNNSSEGIQNSERIFGGDGTFCFIDKDGTYMLATYLYNRIVRFNLPYTSASAFTISSDKSTGSFLNAMDLDENLDILYSNGTNHLARFSDITTSTPIRTNITNALLSNITAIKVSPFTTTSSKVFAGTRAGKLVKVENADTETQTITDIFDASFLGSISNVEFGAAENEIMVTFYNFGVESIWFTDNGGATWANKEGDFPDITVRDILMNPLNNDEVIIATELGVWNTNNFKDASPKWNQSYNGMSNVAVTSLSLRTSDDTILASSYGRGLYTGKFSGNDLTVWTGNIDTNFANTNNWSNGLPTSSMDVKIPATTINPMINTAISVANISIEKKASLTVGAFGALTIEENCTNEGVFTINSSIANSGSLILKGTSAGNITYNRYVSDNWHLISAPLWNEVYDNDWVAANSIQASSQNINSRGIGTYNNDTGKWQYMLADDILPFTKGKGFAIKRTTEGNTSFTGTIPDKAVNIAIDTGTSNSFNLIGNPFPSYVALNEKVDGTDNFLTINNVALSEMTIWYWNGSSYKTLNQASSARYLAPGQAFFIKSIEAGATVSFTKALQQHQSETFLKKVHVRPEIRLICKKGNEEKYTDIFYIKNATKGFDNGYDSSLYTGVSSSFEIYTQLINREDDKNLAIQSIPKEDSIIIPVGITASKNSEIEISMTSKNLDANLKVYLEDRALEIFTLLGTEKSTYTFTSDANISGSERFFLHTSSKPLNTKKEIFAAVRLFSSDKKIHFKNLPSTTNTVVTVYDLKGTEVLKQKLYKNQESMNVATLLSAIYLVTVKTDKGVFKKKILVQ